MRKRIVYTRPDGGVSVCSPAPEAIAALAVGAWGNAPRGEIDLKIDRSIANGIPPDAARRYIRGMHFGGCTEAEALAIIRDRDCAPHGTAIELWDIDDIPDRWFRNAWARSHNGGPISISLKLAKPLQFAKIRNACDAENERRKRDIDLFDRPLELNWGHLRDQIHAARDDIDLRRVWPEALR